MPTFERRYVHIEEESRSLSVQTDEAPMPGAGEVLIAVDAAGINRADLLQRKGLYPPPPDASPIMGLEVSGTVCAVGAGVDQWAEGDPICALTHGGGYASHTIAPVGQCLPVPASYSLREAAGLPEAVLTVWHNIFQRAGFESGNTVLIHGGASGVGSLGVAMCQAMGGRVFSTAGSDEKCRRVEALGAERAINYRNEDYAEVLAELGLTDGVDIILDMVGGDYIQKNLAVAAPEGRIVNIAYQHGFTAEVNFLPVLLKRLTVTGSTLRAQSLAQKTQMVREIRDRLFEHLDSGAVKSVIDREFPLEDALAAQDYMESGVHMGKILLIP
ncbi:MAG: NAD(P)H-quinone oxidoreductase [Pseudomonadota bacterium]